MKPARSLKVVILSLFVAVATTSISHAQSGDRVYIPTGDSAQVLVIDTNRHVPVGRIDGLSAAHGLAVTPDGSRLIVGSFDERAPGESVPEKPASMSASDHAAHHAPRAGSETQAAVSTLSIVETATQSVVRRIDVPGAVHHVAVSPDGRVAVVTHSYADAVTLIDLEALDVIGTVTTGASPNYAAFSPDGSKLFVSNSGEDTIAILDRSDWSVSDKVAVGQSPEHLVLSPDRDTLFVNNVAGGSVSVIDLQEERVAETLSIGADLHGIDLSEDGRTLFIALRGDDGLMAIDLRDGSRRSTVVSPAPYHLGVIGGAGVLYLSSADEPVVWVIDTATLETRAEIAIPGIGHQFAQAPGS